MVQQFSAYFTPIRIKINLLLQYLNGFLEFFMKFDIFDHMAAFLRM